MKAVLILCALSLFAMAAAKPQGVNVVDNNPEAVKVVNPDQVHVVDNNPSAVHVVDHYPGPIIDQAFYRPTINGPPNGGYEPISIGPAFVNPDVRPYGPGKQYDNPNLRGGK